MREYTPLPWQAQFHRSEARIRRIFGGPGSGKTTALLQEALRLAHEGKSVMVIAPSFAHAKQILWSRLLEMNGNAVGKEHTGLTYLRTKEGGKIWCGILPDSKGLERPDALLLSAVEKIEESLISGGAFQRLLDHVCFRPFRKIVLAGDPPDLHWSRFTTYDRMETFQPSAKENVHLPAHYRKILKDTTDASSG